MRLPSSFRQETAFGITKEGAGPTGSSTTACCDLERVFPARDETGGASAQWVWRAGGAVCGRREESRAAERTGRVAARPA
ncbi:unnamed protein product, partial [Musa hybrid cultivar]